MKTKRAKRPLFSASRVARVCWPALAFCASVLAAAQPSMSHAGLQAMDDAELAGVAGQGLFLSDKIDPSGAAGSTTDFTYYRVALDAKLEMNLNIDKLQLGCGGVNDGLVSGVCDIDLEYVRFLGRGSGQTSPDGLPIVNAGEAATSDFTLLRPYLEIAIRNDANKTSREIAGIKIGAQTADGYMGLGRVLCRGNNPACHEGVNAISGFLNVESSAEIPLTVGVLGNSTGCYGDIACGTPGTPFYFDTNRTSGTRQTALQQGSIPLQLNGGLAGILGDGFAHIAESLKFIHGFELANTNDFYLSFQREQIRYPTYDKSGYSFTANTGWWMNVPDAKLTDINAPQINIPCGLFGCLGAIAEPGAYVENVELNLSPPDNCYGASVFC